MEAGATVAEIVDPLGGSVPVAARTSGVLFARHDQPIAWPGKVIGKIAGRDPLPERTGALLTDSSREAGGVLPSLSGRFPHDPHLFQARCVCYHCPVLFWSGSMSFGEDLHGGAPRFESAEGFLAWAARQPER